MGGSGQPVWCFLGPGVSSRESRLRKENGDRGVWARGHPICGFWRQPELGFTPAPLFPARRP